MKFDMELNEAGIRRFWSINSENCKVTITHGKINNKGIHFVRNFQNYQQVSDYINQSVQNKLNNGYKITRNFSRKEKNQTQVKRRSPRLNNKKITKSRKVSMVTRRNLKDSQGKATQNKIEETSTTKTLVKSKKQQYSAPNLDGPQGEVDKRIKMSHRYTIFQKDGFQYDILTKQNSSYYILQILVDQKNSQIFKIYTRWGSHGSVGRFQLSNCRDEQHALKLFAEKFAEKTGRSWDQRFFYRPQRGKYIWINPLQYISSNNNRNNNNLSSNNIDQFLNDIRKKQTQLNTDINSISTNSMDIEVQDGDVLLDDLISQILSPTSSELEDEDFNVPITCQQCEIY